MLVAIAGVAPIAAQEQPPSLRDSFPLGSDNAGLCQVESKGRDPAIGSIFDRAWAIVCRDAARPVGRLYSLRGTAEATSARLQPIRAGEARCTGATDTVEIEGLGTATRQECRLADSDVGYRVYSWRKGNTNWVAEGLAGYDDALKLGLRTLVADRLLPGKIEVATTSVNDPVAFARVQAGTLDPDRALAEGYRRNNAGAYAEAAEFFGTLQQRADGAPDRTGEYLINEALQKSNLGQFAEADRLFEEAARIPTGDRVQTRLRRNFRALHLINQRQLDQALAELDRPVTPLTEPIRVIGGAVEIASQVAAEINAGAASGERLGTTEAGQLTPEERAVILDAQALQLRGTILRMKGRHAEAVQTLEEAARRALSVRSGRVISIVRLRSQIMSESAAAFEAQGNASGAEERFRQAIVLLEQRYPDTNVVAAARSRLAAFLLRQQRTDEALALYKIVVDDVVRRGNSATGLSNLLAPYFEVLAGRASGNPALTEQFFLATQTLVRPGVADTQSQLSRQLSQGTGEAATLFRQAIVLQREVERTRVALATLRSAEKPDQGAVDAAAAELDRLEREQAAMQARLSEFPQYRALSTDTLSIADLRGVLKPDESYLKLAVVGQAVYGVFVTPADATVYKLPITADTLDQRVDALRATISRPEDGQVYTYPFDLELARKLYLELTGPVANRMAQAKAVIFEPDGAMLRLPLALLPVDQASVDRYRQRASRPGADKFDFSGVQWLGRNTRISTAVSARGFRDARRAPPSAAQRPYLGFGENAPAFTRVAMTTVDSNDPCQWPLSEWNKPISARELRTAQSVLGSGSDVMTGAAFTDEAVMARGDLAQYRILHFATHGFVTAPQPQCPARPALLTSFGDARSDGLLSFKEIYDLHMDADLVLLSACDTAGRATVAATREAGVTTGGGSALDGLVRAFIGAGARSVLASHWPAPDEYQATERLISSLFQVAPGTSIGDALKASRLKLMDEPETSHPFYWAGFVLVGDGAQPIVRM
ncbi:CHAT domain-containing tetratricopeptide repeat protein [Sphingomonas sp.]|jgi:CHAT domain-containing protein|uniref:CHAT domain-containing protein n=1 Tax=Sphingomonas sp. TaxID=28214 RepID=UPI002DF7126F|nr:CHAT domain-containing tetratricopeptide repeat protein [Sphingomonas sp.]